MPEATSTSVAQAVEKYVTDFAESTIALVSLLARISIHRRSAVHEVAEGAPLSGVGPYTALAGAYGCLYLSAFLAHWLMFRRTDIEASLRFDFANVSPDFAWQSHLLAFVPLAALVVAMAALLRAACYPQSKNSAHWFSRAVMYSASSLLLDLGIGAVLAAAWIDSGPLLPEFLGGDIGTRERLALIPALGVFVAIKSTVFLGKCTKWRDSLHISPETTRLAPYRLAYVAAALVVLATMATPLAFSRADPGGLPTLVGTSKFVDARTFQIELVLINTRSQAIVLDASRLSVALANDGSSPAVSSLSPRIVSPTDTNYLVIEASRPLRVRLLVEQPSGPSINTAWPQTSADLARIKVNIEYRYYTVRSRRREEVMILTFPVTQAET